MADNLDGVVPTMEENIQSEEERLFPNSEYLRERWNWNRPIRPSKHSPIRYYDNLVKDAIELLNGGEAAGLVEVEETGGGSDSIGITSTRIDGQPRYVGVTDILELNVTHDTEEATTDPTTTANGNTNSNSNNDHRTIYIGNLLAFLWQSWGGQWVDIHEAVAAYWAIHDFNHRISRFPDPKVDYEYYKQYKAFGNSDNDNDDDVPDLFYNDSPLSVKRLTNNCPLYLTLTVRDNTDNNYVVGKIWSETFYDLDYTLKSKHLRPIATMGNYASRQAAIVSSIAAVTTTGYRRDREQQQHLAENSNSQIQEESTTQDASTVVDLTVNARKYEVEEEKARSEDDSNVGIMVLSSSSGAPYLDDVRKYPLFGRIQTGRTPGIGNGIMMYYDSIGCERFVVLSHIDTSPEFLDDLILAQSKYYSHISIDIVRYTDDPIENDQTIQLLQKLDMRYHLAHSIDPEMLLKLIDSNLVGTSTTTKPTATAAGPSHHNDKSSYDDTNVWLFFGGALIDYLTDPVIEYNFTSISPTIAPTSTPTSMPTKLIEDSDSGVDFNFTLYNSTNADAAVVDEGEVEIEVEEVDEVTRRLHEIYFALHNQGYVWFSNRLGSDGGGEDEDVVLDDRKSMMQEMMFEFRNDPDAMKHLSELHLGGEYDIFGRDKEKVLNVSNPFFDTFTDESYEKPIHDWMLSTYDLIMSMGIAACQEMSHLTNEDGNFELFNTKSYFERWKNVEFVGATGNVAFDTITGSKRRSKDFAITIYHLETISNTTAKTITLEDHTSIHIGYDDVTGLRDDGVNNMTLFPVDDYPFRYPLQNGSSTVIPPSSLPRPPVHNKHLVPIGVQIVCWTMSAIIILGCLLCLIWTFLNKHRNRLQASQPIFLGMLCIGSLVMACATIPLTFQEGMGLSDEFLSSSCMATVWLLSIGFSITFAALIAKTWRIWMLYNNAIAMRRTQVLASHVFWIPLSVFAFNMTVLCIWTIVDPLKWARVVEEEDVFERPMHSKGTCFADISYTDPSFYFALVLTLVNLFAFLGSGYQSYVVRKLPSAFNESVYLALMNAMIVESFLIGVPLLTVLNVNPTSFMVVSVWIIVLVVVAVVLPMFGPKITDKHLDARISFVQNEVEENTRQVALNQANAKRMQRLVQAEEEEKKNGSFGSFVPQMSFTTNSNTSTPRGARLSSGSGFNSSLGSPYSSKPRFDSGAGSSSILMTSKKSGELDKSSELSKSVSFQMPSE